MTPASLPASLSTLASGEPTPAVWAAADSAIERGQHLALTTARGAFGPTYEWARRLDPDDFRTNGMQRWIPGQAAYQAFFNEGGRAFCLYIVLGSYLRRADLAVEAERVLAAIRLSSSIPPGVA